MKLEKDVPFVGQAALRREKEAGGPPRRLVGLDLDWADLERLYAKHGLSPALSANAWRDKIPIYDFGEQVGRATSGSWSLVLKKNLAMGTVAATSAKIGTELEMEWSVEGERGSIGAEVVELPFFDPPRKRSSRGRECGPPFQCRGRDSRTAVPVPRAG